MGLFRRFIKTDGRVLPLAALFFVLFYIALSYFTENQVLMLGLHVTRILIAASVIITYSPHWVSAFKAERLGKVDQLALGVLVTWTAVFVHASYSLVWRALGNPDWMIQSDFAGVPYFIALLGGTLHITAMRTEENTVPLGNVVMVALAFICGILAGLGATFYSSILHNMSNLH